MNLKTLLFIAVLVVMSILNNWWKKRQEGREEDRSDSPDQPRKPQPPAQSRPASGAPPSGPARKPAAWEEELRRLLQGGLPSAAPPPPIRVPPRLPDPAPPTTVRPSRAASPKLPAASSVGRSDPDMDAGLSVQMPTLTQSAQAYLRASHLGTKVADQMRRVEERVTAHKLVSVTRAGSPVVRQAMGLVRDQQSLRAAILAGVILGPPRALQP